MISTLTISMLTILELMVSTHLVSTLTISALTMLQRNTGPAGEAAALSPLRTLVLTDIAGPGGIGDAPLCEHALTSEN
jgi:hypothetical protein